MRRSERRHHPPSGYRQYANPSDQARFADECRIGQMIANLKIQWQQETIQDFSALQDVADSSQDKVVMILLHLQQRIIMAGPIENMKPRPLFWESHGITSQLETPSTYENPAPLAVAQLVQSNPYLQGSSSIQDTVRPTPGSRTPSNDTLPPPPAYRAPSSPRQGATFDSKVEEKPKPITRMSLFGRKKKEPVAPIEPAQRPFDASLPFAPQHLLQAVNGSQNPNAAHTRHPSIQRSSTGTSNSIPDSFDAQSRVESVSTRDDSSIYETEQLDHNPWATPDSNTVSHTNQDARSFPSSAPSRNSQDTHSVTSVKRQVVAPITITVINSGKGSISAKDLLPSEANKYSGFCRGAWRLQIGDKKKAMDERQKPGSMYNALKYWQCTRCKFEGRLVQIDKKTVGYDRQVMLADGIQFRWEFLFKSHVECRDPNPNPLRSTFGCIFCCAEGKGTPTFGGAQSFMDHLQEHRVRPPVGEVLYRMNARVGEKVPISEDFDINIEIKEGITI